MWQKLSLRSRLNLLLALVLVLGLAVNIGRLALEAAPRVQAGTGRGVTGPPSVAGSNSRPMSNDPARVVRWPCRW